MNMRKKRLLPCVIILLFFLQGCLYEKNYRDVDTSLKSYDTPIASMSNIDNIKEIYFNLGTRYKTLSNIPNIDNAVITVNGYAITQKDIEKKIIQGEFSESVSEKEAIEKLIREKAIMAEAIRLGIEANQEELDAYLNRTKKAFDDDDESNEILQVYIDARGITQEAFFEELREIEYEHFREYAWWDSVKPKEKILAEAKERNIDVNDVNYEYHEKYVDELVEKAKIDILDSEIEKILSA